MCAAMPMFRVFSSDVCLGTMSSLDADRCYQR